MKKTIKSSSSPAPATSPAAAPKSAPKSVASAPTTVGEAPKTKSAARSTSAAATPAPRAPAAPAPTRIPAPIPSSASAPAPARDEVPASVPTVITAQVDVGFGNTLYLRGDGPGLSWNKGVRLDNVSTDHWKISLSKATKPVTFKFLINDQTWNSGEDYVVKAGSETTLTPFF